MEQNSNAETFAEAPAPDAEYGMAMENCSGSAASGSSDTVSANHEFQTMKPGPGVVHKVPPVVATNVINTTNGRSRAELPHNELVKMLYYLEGELQARDVCIAALRNERVKQLIAQLRTKRLQPNDPYAAIFRDKIALNGNLISRESSTQAAQAEMEVRQIIEQQMEQQYQMVSKQRATHVRMVNILTESLENNQRMLQELEEEKRKHEHTTAQGDDITYGLEMERTKLKQDLEEERAQVAKMEKDLKKLQETLEYERNRQKQIVLLLIAERKKILMKYIEEGKRSEDLAQILAEEKQRSDTIAEGLEEESKKSLRMEEELEKQTQAMELERKALFAKLAKEELRVKELEQELNALRSEHEALKKQQPLGGSGSSSVAAAKARQFSDDACATPPMVNIAKIVQPTATVSSMPVSGPQTGIARSIAPGQNIRSAGIATAPTGTATAAVAPLSAVLNHTTSTTNNTTSSSSSSIISSVGPATASVETIATVTVPLVAPPSPSPAKMQPTATIQRAPGGKYAALAAAAALDQTATPPHPHPVPIAVPPVTVPPAGARGAPPPIPIKPIVPPKREPSLSRLGSITGSSAIVAATAAASTTASVSTSGTTSTAAKHN
ncbi:CTTNBP2 N-terminal-like protein [Drosophila gunungcola]|uniref:CTTNBP2 N-terminal-like protein n=1 Tax=Drosophila gunungcola TaxID=103775 RepID=UPI0022E970D3|nr:CTTNBP2 N-terminal-like protein [Drosophila gunungcola]XP_052838400.1 CTTNBP2 N-terminal-like protein [Drosophila gunungcola]XP_052838401.1 CTTNBP2 N-terminal-like protein [Drosophila gunungcola]XP_052838402.1 CTTNBP2 N-terminal-like protein [Drosophila gunungcola]